ncbi:MAG TPA: adenylate/guanylate cyclase domain-containing protein [Gemmatimonadota bacterium]|nr:adenylate/guanylate cyclase domain-containing protein [Gemmatimonadota bacterium]
MNRPETRFAWNGEVSLAYQVCGNGPSDLVYLQGYCSNVDLNWESPHLSRFLRGLASFARLIVTDRRGWGCSERFTPGYIPDVDILTDDVLAVLSAAGSERASIMATYESAIVALLFAATYPERTIALILVDPQVTYLPTEETPWMPSLARWQEQIQAIRDTWGTLDWWDAPDGPERTWFARYARGSVTPGGLAAELTSYHHTDICAVLPTIQVPTLVLVDSDRFYEVLPETGHFVASKIPGAHVVEHSSQGGPHFHWYARADAIIAEVRRFLAEIGEEEATFDRILATVLFTDIVDSTKRAAELGDRRWRNLVQEHDAKVRGLLARYRGIEISTAGDSFFATFDGPARAVRCAMAICDAVRPLGIEVRAGLHTGEVERTEAGIGGLAVNIGARVAALASRSEVLVSQTVRDLMVGSDLTFVDRGSHELKGVPGVWALYAARRRTEDRGSEGVL